MEDWWLIIGLVSLVCIILWNPVYENMTNEDVMKKLDFHQSNPTKWDMDDARPQQQLKGPKVPDKGEDEDEPKAVEHEDTSTKATYPHVYGPESTKSSGSSDTIFSSQSSVQHTGFQNFPSGPSEPQPFLSDFSKMLK